MIIAQDCYSTAKSDKISFWHFDQPFANMVANQQLMTDVFLPKLDAVAPNSGVYMNEVGASLNAPTQHI